MAADRSFCRNQRIGDCVLASGLDLRPCAQCFSVCEVGLQRYAMPLRHLVGHEHTVVVSIAEAGVHADPRCQLAASPERGPGIAVFIIDRGKLNAPPSRSLHKLQTLATPMFLVPLFPSFAATACVQLAYPAQYAGFKAASKNGWGVTAARFPAQFPPACLGCHRSIAKPFGHRLCRIAVHPVSSCKAPR